MHSRTLKLLLLSLLILAPLSASAQATRLRPVRIAGSQGIRPFIGAYGDMQLDDRPGAQPVTGDKFIFGADLLFGPGTGLSYVAGLHMGAGNGDFVLQPLFEAHYRFDLPVPLVPWVGGGMSLKVGFASGTSTNLAITFRIAFGAEWYLTDTVAIGTQLVVPDIGPRLLPSVTPIGTVEWLIGPHFRF